MESNAGALPVTGTMCSKKPYYTPLAESLLPVIRAWFENPENEAEFQAYLREQEQQRGA